MNNAEAQRAQKMKENAQKEVETKGSKLYNSSQSGREAAEKSGQKTVQLNKAVDDVIKDIKSGSNAAMQAQMRGTQADQIMEYAKQYNVDPDDLSMALWKKTGWLSMEDVKKVQNRNKKG